MTEDSPASESIWPAVTAFLVGAAIITAAVGLFILVRPAASAPTRTTVNSRPGSAPTRLPTPIAQALAPTATALSGCYDVSSPADTLELVTVDPPLSTNPINGLHVTVRYNLESQDTAVVTLLAGVPGGGRAGVSRDVPIQRGSGTVTVDQGTYFTGTGTILFYVYLSPALPVYRAAGFTCFRPIFVLALQ